MDKPKTEFWRIRLQEAAAVVRIGGVVMAEQAPLNEQEKGDLVAFLDGELAGAAARRIEARLSLDPTARAEAEALKQAWDLLDLLPRAEPSPQFTSRTLDRLTVAKKKSAAAAAGNAKPWKPWVLGMGWAASLFVATWVGFAGSGGFVPGEPSEMELVQDLRVIENKRYFESIDDLEFLHELDHPEMFGEEVMGS